MIELLHRTIKKKGLPLYLIFHATNQCNADCPHCFVVDKSPKNELSLIEIQSLAATLPHLFTLNVGGGEPFLRKDLASVVLAFIEFSKVPNIQITTNGSLTAKTKEDVLTILENTKYKIDLGIQVSIDQIGEAHNQHRRFPGLFERAIHTLKELKNIAHTYHNLYPGVNITISAFNLPHIKEIYHFVLEELGCSNIVFALTRGQPVDDESKKMELESLIKLYQWIQQQMKKKAIGYEGRKLSWFINRKMEKTYQYIERDLKGDNSSIPCLAGNLAGVMYSDGEVYPCELENISFGNIRDYHYDFKQLWFNTKAEAFRKHLSSTPCFCTHECFLGVNLSFNPWYLL